MDFKKFIESLTTQEFDALQQAMRHETRYRLIQHVKDFPLTPAELALGRDRKNLITVIKMVRDRTGMGIAECKTLVELKCELRHE
jgi:ribosomal protein L7/L12